MVFYLYKVHFITAPDQMNDFRLYFVNTTIGGAGETLCYTDLEIPGYPNTTQDINCYGLTKNVFFFNRYKTIALCHIVVNGKKVNKKKKRI